MKHVTQDQAFNALCDPAVPPADAVKLFNRAYRRSNDATKAFALMMAGAFREEIKRKASDE